MSRPDTFFLMYLLTKIGIKPPEDLGKFIVKLNEANIATRYPEELSIIQQVYTEPVVKDILSRGKEVITWIRNQL